MIFAVIHSMLARHLVQSALEKLFGRCYRLMYNLLAVIKLSIVLYIGSICLSSARFSFLDSSALLVVVFAIQLIGFVVLLLALLAYDLGRFSGITQVLTGELITHNSGEPLQRQFLNQWVRHPLYTGALLILWGGADSSLGFWTAVFGSVYLIIGTLFEERKLIKIYGDEYQTYQKEVPKYFPSLKA